MKRWVPLLLLVLFVLPGCQKDDKPDMQMPLRAPNPAEMQPTSPPGSNSSTNDLDETQ